MTNKITLKGIEACNFKQSTPSAPRSLSSPRSDEKVKVADKPSTNAHEMGEENEQKTCGKIEKVEVQLNTTGEKVEMANPELIRELGRDAKTKVRINETLMGLLLQLDTIQEIYCTGAGGDVGELNALAHPLTNNNTFQQASEETPSVKESQEANENLLNPLRKMKEWPSSALEEAVKDGEISDENLSMEKGVGKIDTPHIDVAHEASEHENNESFSKAGKMESQELSHAYTEEAKGDAEMESNPEPPSQTNSNAIAKTIVNDMYEKNSPEGKEIQPLAVTRREENASVAIKDEGEYHSVAAVAVQSEEFIDKSQDALNTTAKLAIEGEDYVMNCNETSDIAVGGLAIIGESSDFAEEEKAIGSSPKAEGNLCLAEASMEEGDSTVVEEKDVFNSMAGFVVPNKSFKAFQVPQTLTAFAFRFEAQFPPR
eukprot:Gb_07713 [translate_table: standard]